MVCDSGLPVPETWRVVGLLVDAPYELWIVKSGSARRSSRCSDCRRLRRRCIDSTAPGSGRASPFWRAKIVGGNPEEKEAWRER
jgi:hypothetical protein